MPYFQVPRQILETAVIYLFERESFSLSLGMASPKYLLMCALFEHSDKAHVRRYLIDAIPKGRQYDYTNPAVQGVQYCNKIFEIEDSINKKHVSFEERYKLRLQKEQPALEVFWSWLEAQNPVKNSRLDKAMTYISNRREFLDTYLEDGRCSLHNNLSENAIQPFTVGRKNWLFSDSPQGAETSATAYSIVEKAKANNLNIYKYLTYILEQRPNNNWSDEQLETIAP